MGQKDLTVRFCGIAGDGIVTSGKIWSRASARLGLDLMVNDNFSAEIRGLGKSTTDIRISSNRVLSMGDGIDVLVAMTGKDAIADLAHLKDGGFVIYDTEIDDDSIADHVLSAEIPDGIRSYPIPLTRISNENTQNTIARNIVSMGALSYLVGLDPSMFVDIIESILKRKSEKLAAKNVAAFHAGRQFCEEHYGEHTSIDAPGGASDASLINGNEAIAYGALDCGLKFFAGYPITPATKIMEICAKELPKLGGWMLQSEDEIAAISAVLGGWFAGKRSMTSTAGPGLALMSEMINLGVMAEVPLVIANVQRGGPSTGLPTKVEQGDLNIALYGGSGDSPRIVMAPTNAEECYAGIKLAFDLAEKYQSPLIFLSDLFLGQHTVVNRIDRSQDLNRSTRVKPNEGELAGYNRFADSETGISPWVAPGEDGAFYSITGLEHSDTGNPNFDAAVHERMQAKRYRKFESMMAELPAPTTIGDDDAEIGITCWGSVTGSVIEAMELAREEGIKSKLMVSMMINPQPEAYFRAFFDSCREVIIPEMNYSGQYAALMKSRYGIRPVEMQIPSVTLPSPKAIAEKIKEVHYERIAETPRLTVV
ncbi:MAG: 2-oxoacid:acceptor oxidoreductase subunit alpha [Pyrinomonadaceae bacterium]